MAKPEAGCKLSHFSIKVFAVIIDQAGNYTTRSLVLVGRHPPPCSVQVLACQGAGRHTRRPVNALLMKSCRAPWPCHKPTQPAAVPTPAMLCLLGLLSLPLACPAYLWSLILPLPSSAHLRLSVSASVDCRPPPLPLPLPLLEALGAAGALAPPLRPPPLPPLHAEHMQRCMSRAAQKHPGAC